MIHKKRNLFTQYTLPTFYYTFNRSNNMISQSVSFTQMFLLIHAKSKSNTRNSFPLLFSYFLVFYYCLDSYQMFYSTIHIS